jgi:hypothetical protein
MVNPVESVEIADAEIVVEFSPSEAIPGTVKQWFGSTDTGWEGRPPLPKGPWSNEPKKVQWVDTNTQLPCIIVRGPMGALCGYVGIYRSHPWHGVAYSTCTVRCGKDWCYEHSPEGILTVHGGITFSSPCSHHEDESSGICHIPEPGTPDDVWWFGFDCSHAYDVTPALLRFKDSFEGFKKDFKKRTSVSILDRESVYRDMKYVKTEIARLASQLRSIGEQRLLTAG